MCVVKTVGLLAAAAALTSTAFRSVLLSAVVAAVVSCGGPQGVSLPAVGSPVEPPSPADGHQPTPLPAPSTSVPVSGLQTISGPATVTASASRESLTVLLGDSIVAGNNDLVTRRLAGCGAPPTAIHALSARSVNRSYPFWGVWRNSGVDEVSQIAASGADPTRWVVELGTNDASVVSTSQQADALLRSLLSRFDPSDEVFWVTVFNNFEPAGAALINAAIVRSGVHVIDWAAVVAPGDLTDGVHPSPQGAEKLAGLLCAALRSR